MVSVVIPTYNRKKYLIETVQSVLHQTYNNFEIIIIDDGSSDGSKEAIAALHDSRIRYIWQENTGLPAVARNRGIREANGDLIAFLDSDDIWEEKKLELQCAVLFKNDRIGLAGSNGIRFPVPDEVILPKIRKIKNVTTKDLILYNCIINSSAMIRKKVVDTIGYFNEDPQLRASEDREYWLRVSEHFDIVVLPSPLVKYRVHASNISASGNSQYLVEKKRYERSMIILSRFESRKDLKKPLLKFNKKWRRLLSSLKCKEEYHPTLSCIRKVVFSKAFIKTKLKIVAWFLTGKN